MTIPREAYDQLRRIHHEAALLSSTSAALNWDQETYMPAAGAAYRAEQLSLLAGMVHERVTDPRVGELLAVCRADADLNADPLAVEAVNVREWTHSYDKHQRLPKRLVEELAGVSSIAHHAWVDARKASDYGIFKPHLRRIIELTGEKSQAYGADYGYDRTPYDPLLDDYEPGMTTAQVETLFAGLRAELVPLVERIVSAPKQPDRSILTRTYPVESQRVFSRLAAALIGFDFGAGRLDEVVHPFCTELGPRDIRLTTRYNPRFFNEGFFGVMHEAGHGIYEQNLPHEHFGTPMGAAVSLAIHESQSRMWENFVGRGLPFWRFLYNSARGVFSTALADVPLEAFYHAINDVQPSFIRVEADEVTYNLHIILRFELEQMMMSGEVGVDDIPAAWNERFQRMFGLKVPDDAHGCLQDVHWSMGGIGYFSTYCLGNMVAAQLFETAHQAMPDLDRQFEVGNFAGLLGWLRANIHSQGMRRRAMPLVEHVTGRPLDHAPLMRYLKSRFEPLYGVA
jgi:carboxypeptidase Taq